MNILMTCCLGDHMKSNIEDLKDAFPDIKIVGIDARKMYFNHNGVDVFHQVCKCDDEKYVEEVLNICKEENVELILSFSSLDIAPFKINKKKFDDIGVKIALGLGDDNRTMLANNKWLFCAKAKGNGLKVVDTELVLNDCGTEEFAIKTGAKKVVLKQLYSTGAKGMEVLNVSDLNERYVYRNAVVVQPFLPGTEYSVDCFCKNGKVTFACTKVNYEMDLGVSIYSEIIDRPNIVSMCEDICKKFCLDGLVGFDLKEDENGEVFVLECNPRPTATISLVKRAGVNLLKHLVEYYMTGDTSFEGEELKYGMKVRRYREDYYE